MKKFPILIAILASVLLIGCADSKEFNINGKKVVVEPYGWIDKEEFKNDSVVYEVNTGNVVWSILLSETIVAPILLTGTSLYEPVGLK